MCLGFFVCVPTQIRTVTATSGSPGRRQQAELTLIRSSRIPVTPSWTWALWFPWRRTAEGRRAARKPSCTSEFQTLKSRPSTWRQKKKKKDKDVHEAWGFDPGRLQKAFLSFAGLCHACFFLYFEDCFCGLFFFFFSCKAHSLERDR